MKAIAKYLGRLCLAFAIGATAVGVVGCSSAPKQESTGEYFDDSVITTKVKAAIFNDSSLSPGDIKVETYKGVVQLSGFVRSRDEMTRAVQLARGVPGVKEVRDNMQLK